MYQQKEIFVTSDEISFHKFLFQSLVESSNDLIIIKSTSNSLKVKSVDNSKNNLWSYNVNFKYGTLRRLIAYKCYINYPSGAIKVMSNKFSYYCNVKNKVKKNSNNNFSNETYCKIYDSFEMFKRLIHVEKSYNSKYKFSFVEENNVKYGLRII